MLSLTRKPNEEITITTPTGEQIRILIARVFWNRAVIGIEAPKSFGIVRNDTKKVKENHAG